MPIIGDKARFAVEYQLRGDGPGQQRWLHGSLCAWAGGVRIGRDEPATLGVAIGALPAILANAGRRRHDALMNAPAERVFAAWREALYKADDALRYRELVEIARPFEAMEALPELDVFDGWQAVLLEDDARGRFICRAPDGTLREQELAVGAVDQVYARLLADLWDARQNLRAACIHDA